MSTTSSATGTEYPVQDDEYSFHDSAGTSNKWNWDLAIHFGPMNTAANYTVLTTRDRFRYTQCTFLRHTTVHKVKKR